MDYIHSHRVNPQRFICAVFLISFLNFAHKALFNGDTEALIALSDAYIDEYGGNGAHEIRNWLVAMGAMGSQTSELLCYEAIPEWINGVAVAELKRAA